MPNLLQKPVSDRATFEGLTQSPRTSVSRRRQTAEFKQSRGTAWEFAGVCDTLLQTARKSLILNGEMSEWLKEHAWKLIPSARADAHRSPPTHFRSTTSRNNDLLRRVPVNDGIAPGFRGVCDTVLTQFS